MNDEIVFCDLRFDGALLKSVMPFTKLGFGIQFLIDVKTSFYHLIF